MSDLINKYPYTDFHAVNLDYILKLVRANAGLHLEESGNQILLKTADNTIVSAITAPYAASAGSANTASSASYASTAGSASSAGYATNAGTAAAATNATNAVNANHAVTADSATSAASATTAATAAEATHAATASEATHAASADYATTTGNVEHADNAIETITIQGDKVRFTTYDGTSTDITIPFATKAQKDDLGNIIKSTYVADVVDNNGQLNFKDAQGNTIKALTPSVTQAVTDSYGNTIADYVKSISVESGSLYVTIEHGTGTAETIQIPYSDTAWKDTNGNVIKNTYVKRLEIITDANDGQKKLVAYNGDNPEAELFRFPVEAYRAQVADNATHANNADYATSAGSAAEATHALTADSDPNGNTIESYTKSFSSYTTTYGVQHLVAKDGEGNVVSDVDLFERSQILIGFFDKDKTNPVNIFSLTVNQNEVYTMDPDVLAWYKFTEVNDILKAGVYTGYINENDQMIIRAPLVYSNGYWLMYCFDYQANALKIFKIDQGTLATDVSITRLM